MSLSRELEQLRRIYKNVELGEIMRLWLRRRRCAARSLASPLAPRSTTGVRWVVSLTTLPSRIHRIRGTLNSLLDQTEPADEIVLAVPKYSRREQTSYRIPDWLKRSNTVTILPCEDLGPATKLLPVLKRTNDPETRIAVVDDDVVYPPDFLANLRIWNQQYPNNALAYSGWSLANSLKYRDSQVFYGTELRFPKAVDVLRGTWGYVVRRGFFDDRVFDFASVPNECYFVDDVFFSCTSCGTWNRAADRPVSFASDVHLVNARRRSVVSRKQRRPEQPGGGGFLPGVVGGLREAFRRTPWCNLVRTGGFSF